VTGAREIAGCTLGIWNELIFDANAEAKCFFN
jgi:hypothetical protein